MKSRFLNSVLLLFIVQQLFSQSLFVATPEYGFAKFDRNKIIFPADSLAFEHFFEKMDSLYFRGEGNINIVHIGGSHVQAGFFTQQFRRNMLGLSPGMEGGRGLVFPFSVAKTNSPPSYKTRYTGFWEVSKNTQKNPQKTLGLTGMAISTSDSKATISVISRETNPCEASPRFDFNSVKILGYSENKGIEPVILFKKDSVLTAKFDSVQSTYLFNLPDYTDSVTISFRIKGTFPDEFTLTGILLENNLPGISCHGVGVNGASLSSYLKCNSFENDLTLLRPDLIIFGIGINDASGVNFNQTIFMQNYDRLIEKVRRVSPDCALLFITNNDSFRRLRRTYSVNKNGELAQDAFLMMGKKYNAGVWDLFEIMGGLNSIRQWEIEGLAKHDKVHFTGRGYALLGDLLYNALMERYLEHLQIKRK